MMWMGPSQPLQRLLRVLSFLQRMDRKQTPLELDGRAAVEVVATRPQQYLAPNGLSSATVYLERSPFEIASFLK